MMNPKHLSRSFVWSNKNLHNYLKESQKITKRKKPVLVSPSFSIITFDGFYIFFDFFLHFTLTILCVLSRRLLILRARHSFKATIARRGKKIRFCLYGANLRQTPSKSDSRQLSAFAHGGFSVCGPRTEVRSSLSGVGAYRARSRARRSRAIENSAPQF